MVGAPAADDAVARALRTRRLRVGLHVVVACGRPVLAPAEIPDLVRQDGSLSTDLALAGVRYFFRPAVRRQLEREIRAQFAAFRRTGLVLDHVNAHKHMHLHPTVLGLLLKVGHEFGSPPVRLPREPLLASWRAMQDAFWSRLFWSVFLAPWVALANLRLKLAGVAANDWIFGIIDSGRMNARRLRSIIDCLPQGVSEIYLHPALADADRDAATTDPGAREFEGLIDPQVKEALRDANLRLIGFGDIAERRSAQLISPGSRRPSRPRSH
jgi:hopanoid biosynthesis associated protein HpnK